MLASVGDLTGAAEAQKQRYSPEDPSTLEQIRNLKHGCCIVMLRYSILAWSYLLYLLKLHSNISCNGHMRVPLVLTSAAHLPQSHPLKMQLCTCFTATSFSTTNLLCPHALWLVGAHQLLLRQVFSLYICREAEAASLGLDTSKQTKDALSVHAPLAVAAWKGKGSINILVSKGDALSVFIVIMPQTL